MTQCTVVLAVSLHARPAALVVSALQGFAARVTCSKGDRIVDARGLIGLMSLGAVAGDRVLVQGEGDDAAAAVAAVCRALRQSH